MEMTEKQLSELFVTGKYEEVLKHRNCLVWDTPLSLTVCISDRSKGQERLILEASMTNHFKKLGYVKQFEYRSCEHMRYYWRRPVLDKLIGWGKVAWKWLSEPFGDDSKEKQE